MNNITATRAEIKSRAKEALKGHYWYVFGVSLLISVISGLASSILNLVLRLGGDSDAAIIICAVLYIAVVLFVLIPLSTGMTRFFINFCKGNEPQVNDIAYIYKNGLGNVIRISIIEAVYIILWSMLFIIPGIIKTYQYFMIDYMIAENPQLDRKRAFEITKAAMKGNKWRTFVFGLSFIGWILLCMVTLGIGTLFLTPYINAAYAQYYLELKKTAVENGIAQAGELEG